jgi:hypothetical protein
VCPSVSFPVSVYRLVQGTLHPIQLCHEGLGTSHTHTSRKQYRRCGSWIVLNIYTAGKILNENEFLLYFCVLYWLKARYRTHFETFFSSSHVRIRVIVSSHELAPPASKNRFFEGRGIVPFSQMGVDTVETASYPYTYFQVTQPGSSTVTLFYQ